MSEQRTPMAGAGVEWGCAPGTISNESMVFRIGCDGASLDQLPNFKRLAFHVTGKADGCGLYAPGGLISDAFLKLNRPWPVDAAAPYESDPCSSWLMELADGLPDSPGLDGMRSAFLFRVGEFLDIATNCPARLPAIFAGIDALTNERLTERCRAILETGRDPGEGDLWMARLEPAK